MVPSEVLHQVCAVIAATVNVDPARIAPSMSLAADLGIDSLTMVKLVVAVEDRFGSIIPDEQWSRFVTVGELAAHVERLGTITPDWSIQP